MKTYIINMRKYDLIFDFFWIYDVDSNIYWREQFWIYRDFFISDEKQAEVAIMNVNLFASLINVTIAHNMK